MTIFALTFVVYTNIPDQCLQFLFAKHEASDPFSTSLYVILNVPVMHYMFQYQTYIFTAVEFLPLAYTAT